MSDEVGAIRGRVIEVVGAVTRERFDGTGEVSRRSVSAWDSLAHVEILYTLEEEFGVEFDEESMSEADDADGLAQAIVRLRGSAP